MAFKIERMTPEEQQEFKEKKIPDPQWPANTLERIQWTIDRENNMYLVWGSDDREPPYERYFVFAWKGTFVSIRTVAQYPSDHVHVWKILNLEIPLNMGEKKSEIIKDLMDALKIYAFNGDPNDSRNTMPEFDHRVDVSEVVK